MNRKVAKILSNIQYKRSNKKDVRRVRKIINSEIRESVSNGNNSAVIYLGNLSLEYQHLAIGQEYYYRQKGFDVKIVKEESEFISKKYFMEVIWDKDFI